MTTKMIIEEEPSQKHCSNCVCYFCDARKIITHYNIPLGFYCKCHNCVFDKEIERLMPSTCAYCNREYLCRGSQFISHLDKKANRLTNMLNCKITQSELKNKSLCEIGRKIQDILDMCFNS